MTFYISLTSFGPISKDGHVWNSDISPVCFSRSFLKEEEKGGKNGIVNRFPALSLSFCLRAASKTKPETPYTNKRRRSRIEKTGVKVLYTHTAQQCVGFRFLNPSHPVVVGLRKMCNRRTKNLLSYRYLLESFFDNV